MIRKVIIVYILSLFLYSTLFTRTGVGYFFKDKRVMKKFYHSALTHKVNKISDRIYKSDEFVFKANDFNISPSRRIGIKELTNLFSEFQVVRDLHFPPTQKRVLHLNAHFRDPYLMHVDLSPKKEIFLPGWTKSIDFWVLASSEDFQVSLYLEYPNGLNMRYNIPIKGKPGWKKVFINLMHGSTKSLYKDKPIKLYKIRFNNKTQRFPTNFSVWFTKLEVYNYIKTAENLYKEPYKTFSSFESGFPRHWNYVLENKIIKNNIREILDHEGGSLLWQNNKKFLNLNIPLSVHNNKNIFIIFPKGLYKLKKDYQISLWVKGKGQGEELSIIFQEGKWRYFELQIANIYFVGWKKLTVKIPSKMITYFKDPLSTNSYILPLGLKISGGSNPNTAIQLGIDQLEAIIEPDKLGNVKNL
ncbi:MAG: hypothetical protein OEV44_02100 [Spirochaetota bacterium]|nr:hypothetical protein [Spirochaetota bacterium]